MYLFKEILYFILFLRFRLKGAGVGRRVYEMPQVPEKVDRKIDRFKIANEY